MGACVSTKSAAASSPSTSAAPAKAPETVGSPPPKPVQEKPAEPTPESSETTPNPPAVPEPPPAKPESIAQSAQPETDTAVSAAVTTSNKSEKPALEESKGDAEKAEAPAANDDAPDPTPKAEELKPNVENDIDPSQSRETIADVPAAAPPPAVPSLPVMDMEDVRVKGSVTRSQIIEDSILAAPEWYPEYVVSSVLPDFDSGVTFSRRGTRISKAQVLGHQKVVRKTKIICTMGPSCWSEEMIGNLLDAGMNIARFNFSHGDHKMHGEVLERFRKVCASKNSNAACLLDTKGPEIRTAMLRDHTNINLTKDQEIIVEAVGDRYTSFEGFKTETETRIGLSYAKLCQSVKPGNRILLADGSVVIEVVEILSETELKGRVLNDKELGERKNCNLPGVKVDIPVLTEKDIDDLQNFCVKNNMDYVAASFVQTGDDVQFIRRILDAKDGRNVKIISKIENEAGLEHIDDIIKYSDGIMVARGDLGMEIPSEKVALAQKMIITKCNIAGKFVITATQMLESMVKNPLPTRAEMTDVANAVFDGTDCVMLSGETANGSFPAAAVSTMAAIVSDSELGVDYGSQFDFIRLWTSGPTRSSGPIGAPTRMVPAAETEMNYAEEIICAAASKCAIQCSEDSSGDGVIDAEEGALVVVATADGSSANRISKYRPTGVILVVTDSDEVMRGTSSWFGQYGVRVASLKAGPDGQPADEAVLEEALAHANKMGFLIPGQKVLYVHGASCVSADEQAMFRMAAAAGTAEEVLETQVINPMKIEHYIASIRTTAINREMLATPANNLRSTKIICTMGPSCWSEEMMGQLLDAGMNIARFNFSHGDHKMHGEVLERFREVCKAKKSTAACLLDTKGPEIRTAMLKDHKNITLTKDQEIIVEAVGDRYTSFEGFKTETETRIGLSYAKLCQSVKPGNRILLADGSVVIEVVEILSDTELKGRVLNDKELGERKNCNLPGVKVDIPVLTEKDIDDLQNFCVKNKMNYVAASFVQSGEDVQFIRRILDDAGGQDVQIISKIENGSGLININDIVAHSDGIMVARGDLGMEIPSEKVALAQKMIITKCNIAGKFVITATQMLESMVKNPLPTRAEMTDVANAVIDGTDCVMLSGETANGSFPAAAVSTMASIVTNAEVGINRYDVFNFIRNMTPKPMNQRETICSSAVQAAGDMQANLIIVFTNDILTARLVAKWRPLSAILVVTTSETMARYCSAHYGLVPMLVEQIRPVSEMVQDVVEFAKSMNISNFEGSGGKTVITVSGKDMAMTGFHLHASAFVIGKEERPFTEVLAYKGKTTQSFKSTKVDKHLVCEKVENTPKTKIVCTMGPSCWSEELMGQLLDAGMNIARFNFSHGDHKMHGEVLERFRAVCEAKKSSAGCLLDTKGPEIRTAMLKDHANITLTKDQEIIVEAVGDRYTSFEGFKTETETRIGLSYAKLCQSVKPGNQILLADGSVVIEVIEILSETELKGRVLNDKELGERKNCNLPGVKVDIPVLTEKDIDDLQNFCVKNNMDYVAASFVQTGEDVQFIRKILDDAGGQNVQIISKIENGSGLEHIDDVIKYSDGIMVARGDLGMEIPSEKVALAQKMIITKCNIAGKFVITATQMLESMVKNPLPTRAEMTDVANAVFDGTDCVMLSGETANGSFPAAAVSTMASIVANAEVGVNYYQVGIFIRDFTPKPMSRIEAMLCCVAKNAVDVEAALIVVFSETGLAPRIIAKYRPCVPVLVVTSSEAVYRHCNAHFGLIPKKADSSVFLTPRDPTPGGDGAVNPFMEALLRDAVNAGLCPPRKVVVVVRGSGHSASADEQPFLSFFTSPSDRRLSKHQNAANASSFFVYESKFDPDKVLSIRCTSISYDDIVSHYAPARKTKIVCTMGPSCWSEEMIDQLLHAGMNIARFNFSHGDHKMHGEVLERFRKVCEERNMFAATLLDTKGPEIRTAMLRDHKPITLTKGQEIIVEAVGDQYTSFEGYKEENETRIGLSYAKLCQSVRVGHRILLADGSVVIEVVEILSDTELRGRVLNDKELGERKNCNLPGVKVDIPVLTEKDIDDLQNFCVKNKMNYVAASFVQTGEDVQFIRKILDDAGGQDVQIISKIENEAGLEHIDDVIKHSDGIMVARGDLGMEIPSEKVALAQKMIITKCNIAGKFVITATQMLESMVKNPLPTRAEMTDVANAVFDGTDCVMLSGETANGSFPAAAVATMAAITRNAELVINYDASFSYMIDFTLKPLSMIESVATCVGRAVLDCRAALVVVVTAAGTGSCLLSKYRPSVPVMVVTWNPAVAAHTSSRFAQYPTLLREENPFLEPGAEGAAADPAERVLRAVDEAMYRAKGLGLFESRYGSHPVVLMVEDRLGRASLSFTYTNC